MKRILKRVMDAMLDHVVATIVTVLLGVFAIGLYWAKDWGSESVTLSRAWLVGLVAAIVILFVGWLFGAWRSQKRFAALEDPEFLREPWSITDTHFNLRWHLLRKPSTWVHQNLRAISLGYIETTIDGPYHALGNCMCRLSYGDEPTLDSVCPACSRTIHTTKLNGAPVNIHISALKRVTLEQLQRLNRQGVTIRRGLKSDSLANVMLGHPVFDD